MLKGLCAVFLFIFSSNLLFAEDLLVGKYSAPVPAELQGSHLTFRHRLLGVVKIRILDLEKQARESVIDSGTEVSKITSVLSLGTAEVKLSRGVKRGTKLVASVVLNENQKGNEYLRLRLTKPRKSGRVFEITSALKSQKARTRNVSLRALNGRFCGQEAEIKALALGGSGETSSSTLRTAAATYKSFTVTTDCDYECYSALGGTAANDRIAEFVNSASSIYKSNFGYALRVTNQVARSSSSTYPPTTTNAGSLLSLFVSKSSSLPSADIKHLITGKDIDSNVVGLSYVGVVCSQPSYTLGYSQHISSLLTPVVIAHEIGHNFNADHDPSNQGVMSAMLGSPAPTSFSNFSINEITSYVNGLGSAACYDLDGGSGGPISSSSSSANSSEPGSGSPVGDTPTSPSFTSKFSGGTFSTTINQGSQESCGLSLRIANSKSALNSSNSNLVSLSLAAGQSQKVVVRKLPYVKVRRNGQKAKIYLALISTCSSGSALSETSQLNVAISPNKARGKPLLIQLRVG